MDFLQAVAVLGVSPSATSEMCKAAFRDAVKAARPDWGGGDNDRFRQVIEAYRFLQAAQSDLRSRQGSAVSTEPALKISIDEACLGGDHIVASRGGRSVHLHIAPGARAGDLVRWSGPGEDLVFRIQIVPEPHRAVFGDDLWITLPVDPRVAQDGGRLEVETPFGPRPVWAPRGMPENALLRIKGCGLPERSGYPRGHAFVKLAPDPALIGSMMRTIFDRCCSTVAPAAHTALRAGQLR